MNTRPERVYFENLNAIRFIAAFLVIIHHLEHSRSYFGMGNYWNHKVVLIIGKLGVVMFFVLSGFLISYLLFKEKEITKTINIKHFYFRRLLKIWPLYFLVVFLAFFLFPHFNFLSIEGVKNDIDNNFFAKILLYVFFLPNLALRLFAAVPYASHLWSIGAEEQFYLVWPGLVKKIKNKWCLMFGVIGVYLFIKFALILMPSSGTIRIARGFWDSTPIDCMAIGGLFALMIYEQSKFTEKVKRLLFHKGLQWFVLVFTTTLILLAIKIPYLHYEFYAVLFGIIIVNFAANDGRIFSMETAWSRYLGKISYGIYMYHPIAIVVSLKFLRYYSIENHYLHYVFASLLTIGTAAVSFAFFENRFIKIKSKFS